MKPNISVTISLTVLAMAALGLSACSPPANTSTDSSESAAASLDTSTAEDSTSGVQPVMSAASESVASSAASVVVQTTEIYDEPTLHRIAAKPGYWQVSHTDPKTHKSYTTKVCIGQDLAGQMKDTHPRQAPADRNGYKTDASWQGNCPSTMHDGDVVKSDGGKTNAWGAHRDDHGGAPVNDHSGGMMNDQHGAVADLNGGQHNDAHMSSSSSSVEAGRRPDDHMARTGDHTDSASSSSSHDGGDRHDNHVGG